MEPAATSPSNGSSGRVSGAELADALLTVTHAMRRRFDARLQELDLSLARAKVLVRLEAEGPLRIGVLSEELDLAARTMTSTVESLERDGLVESRPDPSDARARLVAVTGAGEEIVVGILRIRGEVSGDLFGTLSAADRETLLEILDRLRTSMGAEE